MRAVESEVTGLDRSANKRVAWLLSLVILLSFGFGVVMFLPAEHRAQKLEELQQKYQAKLKRAHTAWPGPSGSRN